MPKEYEAIRDDLVKRGKSLKDAKSEAAAIWNSRHPEDPNPWNREKPAKKDLNPYRKKGK